MDIQEVITKHTNSIIKGHFSSPDIVCQCCQQKPKSYKLHESRKRQFRLVVESIVKVTISFLLRWKCIACGATFTEYPFFAEPHKRFVLTDIIRVGHSYLNNEMLRYRNVVKNNDINIGYLGDNDLCEQFMSHSSAWRFMTYLADRYQTNIQHHRLEKNVPSVSPFKYRSNDRKTLLYKAFKAIILFNQQANTTLFPNFETGFT